MVFGACRFVPASHTFIFSSLSQEALTCAAAIAIGLTILWLRSDAIADASRDTGNLATVLAHQFENSVQSIDLVLTEIRDKENKRVVKNRTALMPIFGEDTYRFLMRTPVAAATS